MSDRGGRASALGRSLGGAELADRVARLAEVHRRRPGVIETRGALHAAALALAGGVDEAEVARLSGFSTERVNRMARGEYVPGQQSS